MILKTNRLILRPWEESDAENLYKYASAPEVGPMAGWPVHTSVENSLEIIRNVLSAPETYAVVDKDTGCAVGSIGLMIGKASGIGIKDTEGEVGYWIGVPYWGQGLIPEAVREMIRYAFEELHLEKVWCGYYDGNVKSKRVQEKCGFRYQYTRENVNCSLLNEVRTEHITCLSREEWTFKQKELEMWEAARSRDSIRFLGSVCADAVMVCGGFRCSGLEYSYIIKEFDLAKYVISDFEVVCETEDMCQVHYCIETFVEDIRNIDLQGKFHITSTWRKIGGNWKLVFNMDSRICDLMP